MLLTIFLTILFAAAFFSAENLVITIAGFVLSSVGTQIFKHHIGLQGAGSVMLAIVLSIVIAVAGIFAAAFLGGEGLSWDALVKQSAQIFTLATLAYHVFRPLGEDGNK